MLRQIFLLISFLPLIASCAVSNKVNLENVEAKINKFGLYQIMGPSKVIKTPKTTAGKTRDISKTTINYLNETTNVPAKIGTRFGYSYQTSGMLSNHKVKIKKVFKHPQFKGQKGFTRKSHYTTDDSGSFEAMIGYGFDEPFELVPGTWTLEIWFKNKLLISKSFNVYKK